MMTLLVSHEVEVDIYDLYEEIDGDENQKDFLEDKLEELDQESFFEVVEEVIDRVISDQIMKERMEDRFQWLGESFQDDLLRSILELIPQRRLEGILDEFGYRMTQEEGVR